MQKQILLLLLCLSCSKTFSQVISGPMPGYIGLQEVCIWMEVKKNTQNISVEYFEEINPAVKQRALYTYTTNDEFNPIKFFIPALKLNTTYVYAVFINGIEQKFDFDLKFKTQNFFNPVTDTLPTDFSFLMGSCTYLKDSGDKSNYAQDPSIFLTMEKTKTEFMLWTGDNVYLRSKDYATGRGIRKRYSVNFSNYYLQKFRASRFNYATWDDHDYGSNDATFKFPLKEVSRQCFINYFPQKTFGENNQGVYSKFTWSDCDFFLLDNRWWRQGENMPDSINGLANPAKRYLGNQQMQWLIQELINSTATTKFIVFGNQVLNPISKKEKFNNHIVEYKTLMGALIENKISGVIFLSGDRHFSEMIKINSNNIYPLYDFTCSPLTSQYAEPQPNERENPFRIANSLMVENNYGKISVAGSKSNRKITFELYNQQGKKKWDHTINVSELHFR